jgi:hypothetical protein
MRGKSLAYIIMKKFLAGMAAVSVLGFWTARGAVISVPGPTTVKLEAITQAEEFHFAGGKTNETATSTNTVSVFKATIGTSNLTSADILALLANSFNTNFPAGSQLGMTGVRFVVLDSTGTNITFNPGEVLSTVFSNGVSSETETEVLSQNQKGSSFSGSITQVEPEDITFIYDDTAQATTGDGTHTAFQLRGTLILKISRNLKTNLYKEETAFQGSGSGAIRNVVTILNGTITSKSSGIPVVP